MLRTALAITLSVAACSGDKDGGPTVGDDDDTTTTDTGTPAQTGDTGEGPITALVVTDPNVYQVSVDYQIAVGTLREQWDALVSWETLTEDAWGDPIQPTSIAVMVLLEVFETPDRLADRLAADDLGTDLISTWTADVGGTTFANLSELSFEGTPFAYDVFLLEDAEKTWVLMLADQDGERLVPRHLMALQVDEAGQTAPEFVDEMTTVSWTASLDGAPLAVAGGVPGISVDWDDLAEDALGKPYDERLGDELFVARFDEPASALGASMLALEDVAEAWYQMDVLQDTEARLDLARDQGGTSFPGFDAGGTWLVGVRCTTCLTRLPLWVVVVEVQ